MSQAVYWQPGMKLSDVEKLVIEAALRYFQGNKTRTAASLSIAPATLRNMIDRYQIAMDPSWRDPRETRYSDGV